MIRRGYAIVSSDISSSSSRPTIRTSQSLSNRPTVDYRAAIVDRVRDTDIQKIIFYSVDSRQLM